MDFRNWFARIIDGVVYSVLVVIVFGAALVALDNYSLQNVIHRIIPQASENQPVVVIDSPAATLLITEQPEIPAAKGEQKSGEAGETPGIRTDPLDKLDWRFVHSRLNWTSTLPFLIISLLMAAGFLFLERFYSNRVVLLTVLVGIVVSLVISVGFFSALNNLFVGYRWSYAEAQDKLKARHTLREQFLESTGRLELPKTAEPVWFSKAADIFLAENEDLEETLNRMLPEKNNNDRNMRFLQLLQMSDAELLNRLFDRFGVLARVVPRPSNTYMGYNDTAMPNMPSKQLPNPSVGTPPANAIKSHLELFTANKADEESGAGLGLLARILSVDLEATQTDTPIVFVRRINGLIQFCTFVPFVLCLLIIIQRWMKNVRVPMRDLTTYLPQKRFYDDNAPAGQRERQVGGSLYFDDVRIRQTVLNQERRSGIMRGNMVKEMLYSVYTTFRTNRNQTETSTAVHQIADGMIEKMISEHNLIRYLTWVIPSIGFVGTVIGIGSALLNADKLVDPDENPVNALQAVIGELGVAFDTTFVALLVSIGLMFVVNLLQRREESTVMRIRDDILNLVVFNLSVEPKKFKGLEIRTKTEETFKNCQMELVEIKEPGLLKGPQPKPTYLVVRITSLDDDQGNQIDIPEPGRILQIDLEEFSPFSCRDFLIDYFDVNDDPSPVRVEAMLSWLRKLPKDISDPEIKKYTEVKKRHGV